MAYRQRKPRLESLQQRNLLAGDTPVGDLQEYEDYAAASAEWDLPVAVAADSGASVHRSPLDKRVLVVQGTQGNDIIEIEQHAGWITATVTNLRQKVELRASFLDASVDQLYVSAGDGHDFVWNWTDHESEIHGGAGHDELHGGTAQDVIFGEAGEDFIYGSSGDDLLHGGDECDLISGDQGDDQLWGDAGCDFLYGVTGWNKLRGGDGNDRMQGGDDRDHMWGEDGDDWLHGGEGLNYMYGDDGDDQLHGGEHRDRMHGGEGDDRLEGNGGYDILYGDAGWDWLYGGDDSDYLAGGDGVDVLDGGRGDDRLAGGANSSDCDGMPDLLWGGPGRDEFRVPVRYEALGYLVHRGPTLPDQFVQTGYQYVPLENDLFMDLTDEDVIDYWVVEHARVYI